MYFRKPALGSISWVGYYNPRGILHPVGVPKFGGANFCVGWSWYRASDRLGLLLGNRLLPRFKILRFRRIDAMLFRAVRCGVVASLSDLGSGCTCGNCEITEHEHVFL